MVIAGRRLCLVGHFSLLHGLSAENAEMHVVQTQGETRYVFRHRGAKPNGRLRGTLCAVRHGFLSRVHGFQRKARRIRWHFQPRLRRRSTRSTVASTPLKLAGVDFGNGMPSPNEPLRCRFSGIQKLGNGGDQLSCRNLTSRQIDQRGRISAIRSMNHVDAISALNNSPAT